MFFDRMPDKGTTPQEWAVAGCVIMPLFLILGIVMLVCSLCAGDRASANIYRWVSAGMFAIAVLVWLFSYLRRG